MDYNEDSRKYIPRNIGRPQTRQLVIPGHRRMPHHQNALVSSSSSVSSESRIPIASNSGRLPSSSKMKPPDMSRKSSSRTSPRRRLRLSIPVRMLVYKSGNVGTGSRHDIWGEAKIHYPAAEESRTSKRIYIPIRLDDDNMHFTVTNHRDCVQCPENYMLTPERGSTYVQVPVPEITVCPYLAFVPGRLNVAITSGPRVGSFVTEGEYPVELIVWKRGGHTYSCKFSFTVKLAQCPSLPTRGLQSIHCTNGTLWGSLCHITCPENYIAVGHSFTKCEGTSKNVTWTNEPLECIPRKASVVKNGFDCTKPHTPTGGTVLCDREAVGDHYQDGTVCQYFCFPDHMISSQSKNSSLIICQNGTWIPDHKIICIALYCPQPPQLEHGYVQCVDPTVVRLLHVKQQTPSKAKYSNGTVCRFHCEIGYVIPTSQLSADSIVCSAPEWNASSIPDCKRAVPPAYHPEDCKNKTWVVEPGVRVKTVLPRFTSSTGLSLTPSCSIPRSLSVGVHMNFCEVTDPEFRATSTCSYHIKVIERVVPQPHPKDCHSEILTAGLDGIAVLKPTRFVVMKEKTPHVIEASCTYSKKIGIGSYVNNCSATDPQFNTTAHCSFNLTVKGLSCPQLPEISNGGINCRPKPLTPVIYPPHTTCMFKCDDGYVIITSQAKWRRWKCLPKQLQWNQSKIPKCRRAIAPKPFAKDCHHKTLFLKGRKTIWPKKPRFRSAFRDAKVTVRCLLNKPLTAGLHTNFCEAKDREMRTSSSCSYNITVKAKDCPPLPDIPHSELVCSPSDITFGYQVGIVCRYVCHFGYTIPSSLLDYEAHKCIAFRKWNTSVLPSCVKMIAPTPAESSCVDQVVITNDLLATNWTIPSFISSTGVILEVVCEPSNITEYGVHNISCIAHDTELNTFGSCTFILEIDGSESSDVLDLEADEGCQVPESMPNSELKCFYNNTLIQPLSAVCSYMCLDGFSFPSHQLHLTKIVCNSEYQWNSTEAPVCEAVSLVFLYPSCPDQSVDASNPADVTFEIPEITTTKNSSANISCMPQKFETFGTFEISCEAYDPYFDITAFCTFTLAISPSPLIEVLSTTSILDVPEVNVPTTPESIPCYPLTSPANGHLNCTSDDVSDYCYTTCNVGYHFPSAYQFLESDQLACDRSNGLWNFQKKYSIVDVPDCLGELPTTSWQVWLKFRVAVENCDDHHMLSLKNEIQAWLLDLNSDVCNVTVNCSQFQYQCSEDIDRNLFVLEVMWTVEASFDPEDYENDDEVVPNAETQIEMVLENTQRAVTVEPELKDHLLVLNSSVFQDSYRQGKFILVCQRRGFTVDPLSDKCVECPSGTFEVKGQCEPCPVNNYQSKTGQLSCIPCPDGTVSASGNKSILECKD